MSLFAVLAVVFALNSAFTSKKTTETAQWYRLTTVVSAHDNPFNDAIATSELQTSGLGESLPLGTCEGSPDYVCAVKIDRDAAGADSEIEPGEVTEGIAYAEAD